MDLSTDVPHTCAMLDKVIFVVMIVMLRLMNILVMMMMMKMGIGNRDADDDDVPHTRAMLDKVIFLVIIVMMLKIMTHTCAMAIFILVLFCFPSWRSHLYSCHHCQSSNFSSFQI